MFYSPTKSYSNGVIQLPIPLPSERLWDNLTGLKLCSRRAEVSLKSIITIPIQISQLS